LQWLLSSIKSQPRFESCSNLSLFPHRGWVHRRADAEAVVVGLAAPNIPDITSLSIMKT
jgi:hypothetical protein